MSNLERTRPGSAMVAGGGAGGATTPGTATAPQAANLGDILERVLDKGIVIAGDIQVNLLDIELLELSRIPETDDMLGSYEVELDEDGEMLGYKRIHRYPRSKSDELPPERS